MSKPSHAGARLAAGKKKAKKRPEPRPVVQVGATVVREEPERAEQVGNGNASEPVLQFRPRSVREAAPVRPVPGRATTARATLPTVDYSYVYADLKIIAVLVVSLLVVLIALSFAVR